ncbi:MAG: iron ABC transporter permease [Oscillospiraceae bacterium]|nr:iron ABC transporter permease [Oscillospiraceae bacterium]
MKLTKTAFAALCTIAVIVCTLIIGIAAGSVFVPPVQILRVFGHKLFGAELNGVPDSAVSIIWDIRFPRVMLGFITGAALSVCGAVTQSVLKNPLASPFTLGVSSGASLGAGLVIIFELSFLGRFTLPFFGLAFGIITMFGMVALASRIDRSLQGTTIVLTGMVLSLFVNSIVTLLANVAGDKYDRVMKWQTGSFSGRKQEYALMLGVVLAACFVLFLAKSRDMDLLTFGDEQAKSTGLDTGRAKALLLLVTAVLSGTAVAFSGVIGFIDLISPHIARRLFGAKHRVLIPMSAALGGVFTVLCDLAARTVISPAELPVGVVTSLIGAPFFAWVFFGKRKK